MLPRVCCVSHLYSAPAVTPLSTTGTLEFHYLTLFKFLFNIVSVYLRIRFFFFLLVSIGLSAVSFFFYLLTSCFYTFCSCFYQFLFVSIYLPAVSTHFSPVSSTCFYLFTICLYSFLSNSRFRAQSKFIKLITFTLSIVRKIAPVYGLQFQSNIALIVVYLVTISLAVLPENFILIPPQSIEYLRFIIFPKTFLTYEKNALIRDLYLVVLGKEFAIVRETVRLLGKVTSSLPADQFAPNHQRALEIQNTLALKFCRGQFDKNMKTFEAGKEDILYNPIQENLIANIH